MATVVYNDMIFTPLENGTLSLSEYHGPGGCLHIPALVERLPVSSVDADAFESGGPAVSFETDDGHPFFSVQDGVLYDREMTALIRYPAGRQEASFSVPEGVTDLRHSAFENTYSLRELHLPDTVRGIGSHAFSGCGELTVLRLSDGLTRMGRALFRGCDKLSDLRLNPHHPLLRLTEGMLINQRERSLVCGLPALVQKDMHAPENLQQVEEFAFCRCRNLETISFHHGLRAIGRYAFYHCESLKEVSMPSSVRSIGSRAFSGCVSMRTLRVPDNVTNIEYKAFNHCEHLTLVVDRNSYAERYCRQFHFPCKLYRRFPWMR